MQAPNVSAVTEYQLLGFRTLQEWQTLLFTIFLLIYILTLTGNIVVIIAVVSQDRRLHSPMYTFLQHLSFLEIWYMSTIVPLLLANLASWGRAISFSACMAQLYFFVFSGATECFLLAMMAYDWYLAICSPLHYPFLMSPDTCRHLVALCWLTGVGTGFLPSMMISQLDFCGPNQINHFFCDLPTLMQLSCSSAHVTEMAIFVLLVEVLCICFLVTLMPYVFIVSSILRIPSASGRRKTFSTCGSHLAVVTIYYGTMISMYVRPCAHLSPEINKIISVFYTVVTPLMNPVIYSLRNKDFKEGVRKAIRRQHGCCGVGVRGQVFISSPSFTSSPPSLFRCILRSAGPDGGFTPGGPPLGKVSISTMKVALTAAIFAALVTATAGEFLKLYQDMSCSGQNCTQELDPFTVHVASGEHVHFASQCCQGQPCGNASHVLGLEVRYLLLKGCSDISNSTCQLLGTANQTVGGVVFRQVQCSQASLVPNTSGSFKASLSSWVLEMTQQLKQLTSGSSRTVQAVVTMGAKEDC
ncbi:olfactory receptor 11L1-like [Urocitellus parryii]